MLTREEIGLLVDENAEELTSTLLADLGTALDDAISTLDEDVALPEGFANDVLARFLDQAKDETRWAIAAAYEAGEDIGFDKGYEEREEEYASAYGTGDGDPCARRWYLRLRERFDIRGCAMEDDGVLLLSIPESDLNDLLAG